MNWYVIEEEGRLTAVDAGLAGFRKTLASDLSFLDHSLSDVEALILTHSDPDHTGLAKTLHEHGARVLINAADEPTLRKPGPKSGDAAPLHLLPELRHPALLKMAAHLAMSGGLRPIAFEGAGTFGPEETLDVPGHPRVIATPGHTPGHCVFYFESKNVLLAGDALCMYNPVNGRRGAQVMPSAMNVSTDQCFESLKAIEQIPAQVVLPGHGEPWREGAAAAVESARRLGRT